MRYDGLIAASADLAKIAHIQKGDRPTKRWNRTPQSREQIRIVGVRQQATSRFGKRNYALKSPLSRFPNRSMLARQSRCIRVF
jgi:hypothetical protein